MADYEANNASRQEAVSRVAHRYGQWMATLSGRMLNADRRARDGVNDTNVHRELEGLRAEVDFEKAIRDEPS